MTFREKLADWISGGALSDARRQLFIVTASRDWHMKQSGSAIEALRAIAARETPSANATVKRMARIAREAIK